MISSVVNVETDLTPTCNSCGLATVRIGKLSEIGLHPPIHVFKCGPCRQIVSVELDCSRRLVGDGLRLSP
jgi:hypothetical protein